MTIANVTTPMLSTEPTTIVNAPKFELQRPPRRQTSGEARTADSNGGRSGAPIPGVGGRQTAPLSGGPCAALDELTRIVGRR